MQPGRDGTGASISGEIGMSTVDDMFDEVNTCLKARPQAAVLDLSAVTFLGSTGPRLVLHTHLGMEPTRPHQLQRTVDLCPDRLPVRPLYDTPVLGQVVDDDQPAAAVVVQPGPAQDRCR